MDNNIESRLAKLEAWQKYAEGIMNDLKTTMQTIDTRTDNINLELAKLIGVAKGARWILVAMLSLLGWGVLYLTDHWPKFAQQTQIERSVK